MTNQALVFSLLCLLVAPDILANTGAQRSQASASARVLNVLDAAHMSIDYGGRVEVVKVAGITLENSCQAEAGKAWAQAQLIDHVVRLEPAQSIESPSSYAIPMTVYIQKNGQWIDYGHYAVRNGYAAAQGTIQGYLYAETEALAEGAGSWRRCADVLRLFARVKQATGVHELTLYGLAMNESRYKNRPWPWTLNIGGKGYRFDTKEQAWAVAEKLLKSGYVNFDIGITQTSWKYNGRRYRSTWEALDPLTNMLVAANILIENYNETRDVNKSVGYYHNRSPDRWIPYLRRFHEHVQAKHNQIYK